MIDIAQHLEYLLMHHNCVVVPGLGAFILHYESARYNPVNQQFTPPTMSLGFNPEVRHNDAMLTGSISRREGITIDAARLELDTSIASLRHQLQLCGEFPMGNLGTFKPGSTPDAPIFNPSADSLPIRAYMGLRPIAVTPLENINERKDEKPIVVDVPKEPVVIPLPLKIVASIVAVIIGFGVLLTTTNLVNHNSTNANYASLDTGISSHIERVIDSTISVSREIMLNIAMPTTEKKSHNNPMSSVNNTNGVGRYILVVGSFPSNKTAERYIEETNDPTLSIIEMDSKFRIYAASASRINEARELASELSERYPNVWICRR